MGETGRGSFRSKLVTNTKLELPALAAKAVQLDRVTVIKPQRSNWQIQSYSHTDVLIQASGGFPVATRHLLRAKTLRAKIHKTAIVKHGEAYPFDHRDSVLDRPSDQGISADRITLGVLGTHVTKSESAQGIGATGIEAIKDWDDGVIRRVPVNDGTYFTVQE